MYNLIPIKSATVRPLVNLPVEPVAKLRPYGMKLALASVGKRLLFPLSNSESPRTYNAGASGDFGSLATTFRGKIVEKIMKKKKKKKKKRKLKAQCWLISKICEFVTVGFDNKDNVFGKCREIFRCGAEYFGK